MQWPGRAHDAFAIDNFDGNEPDAPAELEVVGPVRGDDRPWAAAALVDDDRHIHLAERHVHLAPDSLVAVGHGHGHSAREQFGSGQRELEGTVAVLVGQAGGQEFVFQLDRFTVEAVDDGATARTLGRHPVLEVQEALFVKADERSARRGRRGRGSGASRPLGHGDAQGIELVLDHVLGLGRERAHLVGEAITPHGVTVGPPPEQRLLDSPLLGEGPAQRGSGPLGLASFGPGPAQQGVDGDQPRRRRHAQAPDDGRRTGDNSVGIRHGRPTLGSRHAKSARPHGPGAFSLELRGQPRRTRMGRSPLLAASSRRACAAAAALDARSRAVSAADSNAGRAASAALDARSRAVSAADSR